MTQSRSFAVMGLLGFASGLPLYLTFFTLQQWMSERGLSLSAVGLTASIGLPYLLKFLWSPLFDRLPPGVLRAFGRRRGWLLPIQACLTASIVVMAWSDPLGDARPLVLAAIGLAFFSASQDVVIDAWRIESFEDRLQAAALGFYVWGYRIAMLISGAGAIWLAGRLGWHGSYLMMAALSVLGPLAVFFAGEPDPRRRPPALTQGGGPALPLSAPLRDLLARSGAGLMVAFVLLFNLGTQLADTMAAPFYHALGYGRDQVALANGMPALAATLGGAALSAIMVARIGGSRTLLIAAITQMVSIGLYLILVRSGPEFALLLTKVTVEQFAESFAQTSFLAYLSRLCSAEYTATQYALLSSMAPVAWRTLGGTTGFLAHGLGWQNFFILTVACALPGIVLLTVLMRRFPSGLPQQRPSAGKG